LGGKQKRQHWGGRKKGTKTAGPCKKGGEAQGGVITGWGGGAGMEGKTVPRDLGGGKLTAGGGERRRELEGGRVEAKRVGRAVKN